MHDGGERMSGRLSKNRGHGVGYCESIRQAIRVFRQSVRFVSEVENRRNRMMIGSCVWSVLYFANSSENSFENRLK